MSSDINRFNLYLAVCTVNIAAFALGASMTWSSPSLPKLQDKETSFLVITEDQSSWIASLLSLGTVFGPFAGGFLTSRVGRKWTLNVSVVIILISYIILLCTPLTLLVEQIYLARFLAGFSGGIIYAILPMYVAEVSDNEARASLGSFFAFFLSPGFLLNYALGPFVSFNVLIIVSIIPSIIYLIGINFMPETPYYHIQKGHYDEALKSLTWLRRGKTTSDIKEELNLIKESVEESMKQSGNVKDLLATRGNRMAVLLSCSLASFQQLSGINVVLFYGESIFQISGSNFSSSLSTIIIGVIMLLSSAVAPPFARTFGIKKCLMLSAIGMGVFQASLAVYLFLQDQSYDLSQWNLVPVLSLVCYISFYTLGFGPLPWAVMGEVFPSNVKPLGSAITASFSYFISFILGKCFTIVAAYVSFFIFSGFCAIALLFTIFLVPDTRGMSFREIQDLLNRKKNMCR